MLFATLNQGWLFLIFTCAAMIISVLTTLFNTLIRKRIKLHLNSFFANLLVSLTIILNSAIYWSLNFLLNYGEIRLYLIVAYLVGFYLGNTIFSKLFLSSKNFDKMYSR